MTNVPNEIREMWAEIYRLFDRNYLMPNTEDAWNKFWEQAMDIHKKYPKQYHLFKMLTVVGDMISDRMKEEQGLVYENPCTLEDMNLF